MKTFLKFRQLEESSKEAGGILLGCYHGTHMYIHKATEPTHYDIRKKFYFERSTKIHSIIANDLWNKSGKTIQYIGEWHTHPECFPNPSHLDNLEWTKLARARQDDRPVLAIIVGRQGLYIEVRHSSGSAQRLLPAT